MHFDEIKQIPHDVREELALIVLAEIRAETGIPNWTPKLLNGSREFEKRMIQKFKALAANDAPLSKPSVEDDSFSKIIRWQSETRGRNPRK